MNSEVLLLKFLEYSEKWSESHSVVSNSLRSHGLYSPWNSPGQNTGVGSRSLLQGICPTQHWSGLLFSPPGDFPNPGTGPASFCFGGQILYHWATWGTRKLNRCCSVAQLCPTLWDPMGCSTPGLPVHHQLPEFTQTHVHWVGDAIQPSHPLSSPSPPTFNLSQH